jgi:sec-independent protein translocase protein TatA
MTLAFGPAGFGAPELLLIVFVLVLLFGAKKLPEMARGSGRALRIFKAETKGLMSDDDDDSAGSTSPTTPGAISPPVVSTGSSAAQPSPPVEPVVPTYSVDEPASRDSDR